MEAVNNLSGLKASGSSSLDIKAWQQKCYDAMNDDFNTPILIAQLFEGVKFVNQLKDGKATLTAEDIKLLTDTFNTFCFDVLGLVNATTAEGSGDKLNEAVNLLIELRQQARMNKDFELSDKIRDRLAEAGIQLQDGKDGTVFTTN